LCLTIFYLYILWLFVPCILWKAICITNFKFTKYVYKTVANLQHVLAQHRCHHQGVLSVAFIIPSAKHLHTQKHILCVCKCLALFLFTYRATDHFEGAVMGTERTVWQWHLWRAETCWRFVNVWWTYFVHVKLVMQIKVRKCTCKDVIMVFV